ncbi:WXG100 family type VII secretion target [Schaalia sp. 19OD2882]|uniref:WXG100 family type VII secretion target n=1 Tax=Schaalia sp. 19OD2882 TaxID=2794089 RepID=UPI001C1EC90A|nr:WXG100 family type VII secretion target [Schaalia sp. 19OD2882]QWW19295.1 WXG100 family type VII secretion target [Schaalia sp. 19OD2882]
MSTYTVDSEALAASAARVAGTVERLRAEVSTMMADLTALEGTWSGGAQQNFSACVLQWQGAQTHVESALDAISTQLVAASNVYGEAESISTGLFTAS